MNRLVLVIVVFLVTSCGVPFSRQGMQDPLVYDAVQVASAQRIAIFIPGVLASVNIFDATESWTDAGYARVLYRFPGLDKLPNDHQIHPPTAARLIAAFANRYPDKDIALVGYSTGGPIALLAAAQISKGRDVRVAAMSTAVEHGGGLSTVLRGMTDIVRAMIATGSLNGQTVWKRFWAGLLYGPDALDDPAFGDRLARDIAEGDKIIVKLDPAVALAHALGLPGFELPDDLDLQGIPVAVFIGLNDRVFSARQTYDFAQEIGDVTIYGYPEQGHLLFFTRPDVFEDMRAFVEDRPVLR
jgi:pimeloyl-ACP methyl ester carboxylesterase